MARKASFKVQNARGNSSAHNSREQAPQYLVPTIEDNYYELVHSDFSFKMIAEMDYKKHHTRGMQQKQKDALIKETVLNLEDRHTPDDVKKLFKKLNEKYGGHYITELSIHNDEGHFVDKNGITYYPTKHILKKDDGWYIVPIDKFLDDDFKPKKEDFSEKVNIDEFEVVYNKHAHVKFSMYDLTNHKTGRMTKGEVSQRLKVVADELELAYEPEKKISSSQAVNHIKDQHDIARRGAIKNLLLNVENEKEKEYNYREFQKQITALEASNTQKRMLHLKNNELKKVVQNKDIDIVAKNNKIAELEAQITALKAELKQYNFREMQKKITALEIDSQDKKALHRENSQLRKIVQSKDLDIATKNKAIAELEAEIIKKKRDIQELAQEARVWEQRAITERTNHEGTIKNAQKAIDNLEDKNKELKEEARSFGNMFENQTKRVKDLEQENKALQDQNSDLIAQNSELRAKNEKLRAEVAQSEENRLESDIENKELKEQISDLKQKNEELEQTIKPGEENQLKAEMDRIEREQIEALYDDENYKSAKRHFPI